MSTTSPILIVGAGISGLSLGQALLKASIPFHLFESDDSMSFRPQGYRFRISDDGVKGLALLLPPELYSRVKATCPVLPPGGPPRPLVLDAITAQDGERPTFGGRGPPGHNGEVLTADRTVLRTVLLEGLEEHVTFGKEFTSYEITPSGITIRFTDGTSSTGSLLVAADGAMSRIRRQFLPDHNLLDTEARIIYGKTELTPQLVETLNPRTLSRMTLVQDRTAANSQPVTLLMEAVRFPDNEYRAQLPPDYVYWVIITRTDTLNIPDSTLLHLTPAKTVDLTKQVTARWDPSFHPLFDLQNPAQTSVLRVLTTDASIPEWEPSRRVTLIGDAAHVMSPSAGLGATTAIRDAAALATVLVQKDGVNEDSIGAYEKDMRGWAEQALKDSRGGGRALFGMRSFSDLKKMNF